MVVGEGRRSGFVDDASNVKPGQGPGVTGGFALSIVKIGRHRDHRFGYGFF